jgi:putative endonuclease
VKISSVFSSWLNRGRRLSLGQQGEAAAVRYLKRKGYKIISVADRTALGEIDIVAVDNRTIVFVEVKTRRSDEAGLPAEAVDSVKQQRLTRLALSYLKRHGLLEHKARFDVVSVTWPVEMKQPAIQHYADAFSAVGHRQMYC